MHEINWILLLEYLKVLFSWPPIALVIAVIFFWRFQTAINGLMGRIVEGSILGQTIKAAPPIQSPELSGEEDFLSKKAAEAQLQTNVQPNVTAPEPLPPELADDPQAPAAVEWVKNNPVQTVMEYKRIMLNISFERLFNLIYGTQIFLLEFLASRPNESVSLTELGKFYMQYLSMPGSVAYSQQNYMNFLVNFGVIVEAPLPNQQSYRITPHGIQFLSYIKLNYPQGWYQRAF